MADNPRSRGTRDRRINVNKPLEVRHWTEKFGVSEDQLRAAVEAVGPTVEAVQTYLDLQAAKQAGRQPARRATPNR